MATASWSRADIKADSVWEPYTTLEEEQKKDTSFTSSPSSLPPHPVFPPPRHESQWHSLVLKAFLQVSRHSQALLNHMDLCRPALLNHMTLCRPALLNHMTLCRPALLNHMTLCRPALLNHMDLCRPALLNHMDLCRPALLNHMDLCRPTLLNHMTLCRPALGAPDGC
ncbi:unnamed protein product [Arctogadus glacialis]